MEQNRAHAHMGGKVDGCQEFKANNGGEECSICNCHMNYHRRMIEVVYMECHKNHYVKGSNVKDGCKEYRENEFSPNKCVACNCHKSFHRNELIIRRFGNRVSTEVQGKGCEMQPNDNSVAAVEKAGGDKEKSLIGEEISPYVGKAEKQKKEYTPNMEAYKQILAGGYGDDDESEEDDDSDSDSEEEEEEDDSNEEDDSSFVLG